MSRQDLAIAILEVVMAVIVTFITLSDATQYYKCILIATNQLCSKANNGHLER